MKKFLSKHLPLLLAVVAAAIIVLTVILQIQSPESYRNSLQAPKSDIIGSVTLSIRCDNIIGKSQASHIPDNGILLDAATFDIEEGDSVYDVLCEAAAKHDIRLDIHSEGTLYIKGIGNIYQSDFGDLSGWLYRVNGESPSVGCADYVLSDGDVIEWFYSCDLMSDM